MGTVDVCARNSVMCVRSTLLKECSVRIQSSIRYAHVAVPCRNNTPTETTVLCRICLDSVLQNHATAPGADLENFVYWG